MGQTAFGDSIKLQDRKKKWGQGWRNQVICYVTGQFNTRVRALLAGIISSLEALPSSSSFILLFKMSIIPNICNAISLVTLTRTRFNKAINHSLTSRRRPALSAHTNCGAAGRAGLGGPRPSTGLCSQAPPGPAWVQEPREKCELGVGCLTSQGVTMASGP